MEMFDKEALKERLGDLNKNTYLNILKPVEEYAIELFTEKGIECSYDVIAEEMPYFKTMGYTEYATTFTFQPLNLKMRYEMILDAERDNATILDFTSYFKSNINNNVANKYSDRSESFDKYPSKDNLVVLVGSNKIKERACLNKLKDIKATHGDNVYFKPHPITTHAVIGELKDLFGEDCILPREIDLYHFLVKAKKVYSSHMSESVLYSVALGKEVEPYDVYNNINMSSFYNINDGLFDNQANGQEWINKVFSSHMSGFINPKVDTDWKLKVEQYASYITEKRNKYNNWYISKK